MLGLKYVNSVKSSGDEKLHADDKRTRRFAFIVITIVFVVSIAVLLYWAINTATAQINSRTTALITLSNVVKACPAF